MSRISFEVPFAIFCDNKNCRPTIQHIKEINNHIFNNAILNSQNNIIVDGFEEISKCNLETEVHHNTLGTLQFVFKLKKLSKPIENIQEVVNIICAILPASYYSEEYATFNFMIDGNFKMKKCILKITDTPQNIQFLGM